MSDPVVDSTESTAMDTTAEQPHVSPLGESHTPQPARGKTSLLPARSTTNYAADSGAVSSKLATPKMQRKNIYSNCSTAAQ
jgi:hypothetical protein